MCIHGFGQAGRRAYNFYKYPYKVIGFVDSNHELHTSVSAISGLPVVGAEHPLVAGADKILIASMHAAEILKEYERLKLSHKTWIVPKSVCGTSEPRINLISVMILIYLLSPPILILILLLG